MVDFIGIGAARSGTTWISDVLRRHPGISMSEPKEVRYFNRYNFPLDKRGESNPNHDRSIDWYLRHFRNGDRLTGEFTPLYLYDPAAPAAIARHFPDIKLLCSLRHPADRAYSHYWLYRNTGTLGEMSFEEALEAEPIFLDMGFYARQLKRYLEHFKREQMLLLAFDDLVADQGGIIARVLEFLGAPADVALDVASARRNRPVAVRAKVLKRVAHAVSRDMTSAGFGMFIRGLRKLGVHDFVRKVNSSGGGYPPMPGKTRKRLIDTYADDIAELETLLDRDLSAWKA